MRPVRLGRLKLEEKHELKGEYDVRLADNNVTTYREST